MLNARVDENELVALWIPWEVLELARAAVETHEVTLLAMNRGELVHDAAIDTDVLVLCCLTHLSESHLVYLVVTEEVVDGESVAALKSGRR